MVNNIFAKIKSVGLHNIEEEWLRKKVSLVNQIIFISVIVNAAYCLIDLYFKQYDMALLSFLITLVLLTGLLFNSKGYYNVSRFHIVTVTMFAFAFFGSFLGKEFGLSYFFIPAFAGIFIIFHLDELKKIIISALIIILTLVFLEVTKYQAIPAGTLSTHPTILEYGPLINLGFSMVITSFIIYYLLEENTAAERKLQKERNNLKSIIANTKDGIWLADTNYRLITYNKPFSDWYESSFGQKLYPGFNFVEACKNTDNKLSTTLKNRIDRVTSTGKPEKHEDEFHHNEDYVCIELSLSPVIENGQVVAVSAFGNNITERKKAENELKKAKIKAEQASESKSMFLSNMSHELRTPLNAIYGLTQLLEKEVKVPKNIENLEIIKQSTDHLLVLINDILDLSKIEANELTFVNNPFNLHNVFDQLEKTFRYKVRQKGLKLNVSIDPEVPGVVSGDRVRYIQILNNLVNNAVKFTNEGSIQIKVSYEGQDQTNEDKSYIKTQVIDTGIGIPNDKIEYVFSAFKQVSQQINRKFEGTGLGLSICKKLVEMQNGEISLNSKENEGTNIFFTIPFDNTNVEVSSDTDSVASIYDNYKFNDLKVLLVEDNIINQRVNKQMLESLHINVKIAEEGKTALKMLQQEKFDMVLMDIHMPDMDGFEATSHIQNLKNSATPYDVPVIAVSADIFPETKEKAETVGIADFMEKPFKLNELALKISKNLGENEQNNDAQPPAEDESAPKDNLQEQFQMNEEEFCELLKVVHAQTKSDFGALQEALDYENIDLAGKIGHKLKSTFNQFREFELKELSFAIEKAGKAGNAQEIKELVPKLLQKGESFLNKLE